MPCRSSEKFQAEDESPVGSRIGSGRQQQFDFAFRCSVPSPLDIFGWPKASRSGMPSIFSGVACAQDFRRRQQHPIIAPVQQVLRPRGFGGRNHWRAGRQRRGRERTVEIECVGACTASPKSSDSGGLGESDGDWRRPCRHSPARKIQWVVRRTVWARAGHTATHRTAAKGNPRFKYARLKPISNYQASGLDTRRQK